MRDNIVLERAALRRADANQGQSRLLTFYNLCPQKLPERRFISSNLNYMHLYKSRSCQYDSCIWTRFPRFFVPCYVSRVEIEIPRPCDGPGPTLHQRGAYHRIDRSINQERSGPFNIFHPNNTQCFIE